MRILLSGGTGYVGSHLTPVLVSEEHEVAAIVRRPVELPPGVTQFQYSDLNELVSFCEDWGPEAMIHLAADTSKTADITVVDGLCSANILLPLHMAAAARVCGTKRFVNVTTFSTASDTHSYFPQTLYAATKRACEDLLAYFHQSENLSVCNLAFYDIYGPRQPHARFLNAVIDAVSNRTPLSMTEGRQEICFLNVHDAVSAILHCLPIVPTPNQVEPDFYCVYGPEVLRVKDVPNIVSNLLGTELPEVHFDRPYRKNEIMKFMPRAPYPPGWKPKITFAEGLKEIIQEAHDPNE